MLEWMASFEKARRLMLQSEQLDFKTKTVTVTESDTPTNLLDMPTKSNPSTAVEELSAISINQQPATKAQDEKPSIVMLSTSAEDDTQSTSLTPLLVWEASRATLDIKSTNATSTPASPATQSFSAAAISLDATLNQDEALSVTIPSHPTTTSNSSSWGIPWALVPSMFQSGTADDNSLNEMPPTPGGSPNIPAVTDAEGHSVIWPTRVDDSNVPKVDLIGYPPWLDNRNKELRQLFGGVGSNEIVLSGKKKKCVV